MISFHITHQLRDDNVVVLLKICFRTVFYFIFFSILIPMRSIIPLLKRTKRQDTYRTEKHRLLVRMNANMVSTPSATPIPDQIDSLAYAQVV